jgi:hypothetical protein
MLFGSQEFLVGVTKVAENLEPLTRGGGLHFHHRKSRPSALHLLLPKASSACSRRLALFGVVVIHGYSVFILIVPSEAQPNAYPWIIVRDDPFVLSNLNTTKGQPATTACHGSG